jgi:hypothetical protein
MIISNQEKNHSMLHGRKPHNSTMIFKNIIKVSMSLVKHKKVIQTVFFMLL